MNKDKGDWPGMEPVSDVDLWLTLVFTYATPLLYLISGLVFVICSVLLAVKTKVPGRFLILAGPTLIVVYGIVAALSYPMFPAALGLSVLQMSIARLIPALALFASIAGYARLAWWLYKSGRAGQPG